MTPSEKYNLYLSALRKPFIKLCRARFLNPDGSTAFALDNNPKKKRNKAFIQDGSISCNLQNGKRRSATITLANEDGFFDYNINNIWFNQQIAIDEGLILPNGEDFYIQQGIFLIEDPTEAIQPGNISSTYNLVDKWANLDGTLFGKLESTYEIPVGTSIFDPIASLLLLDKGNNQILDSVPPVFTNYYNNLVQTLPDGTTANMTNTPYTLTINDGTYADVILGLSNMLNAWVGYDSTGALRIDPSQDDIIDSTKPVLWQFSLDEAQILGLSYTIKNTEVYNDYIVVGQQLDDYTQPAGRAQNLDPLSDTNILSIGRKTYRQESTELATTLQCQDLAAWYLKRSTVLQKSITVSCSQMFHLEENNLITIVRTDKPGSPIERHLIQGFNRSLTNNDNMTISATSVNDFANATLSSWPE